jgi:predicted transcriptional regulator
MTAQQLSRIRTLSATHTPTQIAREVGISKQLVIYHQRKMGIEDKMTRVPEHKRSKKLQRYYQRKEADVFDIDMLYKKYYAV